MYHTILARLRLVFVTLWAGCCLVWDGDEVMDKTVNDV